MILMIFDSLLIKNFLDLIIIITFYRMTINLITYTISPKFYTKDYKTLIIIFNIKIND